MRVRERSSRQTKGAASKKKGVDRPEGLLSRSGSTMTPAATAQERRKRKRRGPDGNHPSKRGVVRPGKPRWYAQTDGIWYDQVVGVSGQMVGAGEQGAVAGGERTHHRSVRGRAARARGMGRSGAGKGPRTRAHATTAVAAATAQAGQGRASRPTQERPPRATPRPVARCASARARRACGPWVGSSDIWASLQVSRGIVLWERGPKESE